jgi:uncharacterized protein YjbI with pentapeptide repeats
VIIEIGFDQLRRSSPRTAIEGTQMNLHKIKECLHVHISDIAGSIYDDVNMSGSTFGNVNIAGCSFRNVNISGATFEDVNMSGWRVSDVNLSGLKITKSNLQGVSIADSRLDGMTINGILVTQLLTTYEQVNKSTVQNSKLPAD